MGSPISRAPAETRRNRLRAWHLLPHHLLGQRFPVRQDQHTRRRTQDGQVLKRQEVLPQHERRFHVPHASRVRRGLARPHHGFDRLLKILRIGGPLCIQDHQIG